MSELRSKCCGAKVKALPKNTLFLWGFRVNQYCFKCGKPTKLKEKKEEGK